jgi:DNA repair protein RecN (Recombination protein N)
MADCGLPVIALGERVGEARVLIEDVVAELQRSATGLDHDPGELERLESRLYRLEQLMLKYGSPVERVLEHRRALEAERDELAGATNRVERAHRAAADLLVRFDRASAALQISRRAAAVRLAEEVSKVLARLAMAGTRLEFAWTVRPDPESPLQRNGSPVAFDGDGVEVCELQFAANPGEEPRAMARIASGGELSRLHLALRTVLRGRQGPAGLTLLFDEVDSGLGGATAAALAGLLADLATADQVLVVTHLPQVAARAVSHLRIEKVAVDGRAVTRVHRLERAEREAELARMLAGEAVGPSARAHARALLER